MGAGSSTRSRGATPVDSGPATVAPVGGAPDEDLDYYLNIVDDDAPYPEEQYDTEEVDPDPEPTGPGPNEGPLCYAT